MSENHLSAPLVALLRLHRAVQLDFIELLADAVMERVHERQRGLAMTRRYIELSLRHQVLQDSHRRLLDEYRNLRAATLQAGEVAA